MAAVIGTEHNSTCVTSSGRTSHELHEESKLARLSPNSIFLAATPTCIRIYVSARRIKVGEIIAKFDISGTRMCSGAKRLYSFDCRLQSRFVFLPASRPPANSSYPTFWNVRCVAISRERPAVSAPICEWMYVRYVSDDHRPTCMMVLSEAPLSFIAMAPPACKLWDKIRSKV